MKIVILILAKLIEAFFNTRLGKKIGKTIINRKSLLKKYCSLLKAERKKIKEADYFEMRGRTINFLEEKKEFSINFDRFFEYQSSLSDHEMIISGDSGHGKTILLSNIVIQIADNFKENNSKIPIYIEIKSNQDSIDKDFSAFLAQPFFQLLSPGLKFGSYLKESCESLILDLFNKGQLIILIDNYDKASNKSDLDALLNNLISSSKDKMKNIIIVASKPFAISFQSPQTRLIGVRRFNIPPLNAIEIKKYLEYFVKEITDEEIEKLLTNPHLKRFCEYPQTLYRLRHVLHKVKDIKNIGKLYFEFMETNIQRAILIPNNRDGELDLTHKGINFLSSYATELISLRQQKLSKQDFIDKVKALETSYNEELISPNSFYQYGIFAGGEHGIFKFKYDSDENFYAGYRLYLDGIQEEEIKKYFEYPENEVLIFLAGLCNKNEFEKLLKILLENGKKNALLIVDVLLASLFKEDFVEKVLENLLQNLANNFYSFINLDALQKLEEFSFNFLSQKYSKCNFNQKRRIVYFFGLADMELTENMLNDLDSNDLDSDTLHLKYHIIRALGDAVGKNLKVKSLIKKLFFKTDDFIIKCDCLWILDVFGDTEFIKGTNIVFLDKLKDMLNSEKYWVRAHAAGALGRSQHAPVSSILLDRLNMEIKASQADKNIAIKVISYIAEAICVCLSNEPLHSPDRIKAVNELLKSIGNVKNNDYYYVTTAIENLVFGDAVSPAFRLSSRFRTRDKLNDHETLAVLERIKDNPEYGEESKKAIQRFKNIK